MITMMLLITTNDLSSFRKSPRTARARAKISGIWWVTAATCNTWRACIATAESTEKVQEWKMQINPSMNESITIQTILRAIIGSQSTSPRSSMLPSKAKSKNNKMYSWRKNQLSKSTNKTLTNHKKKEEAVKVTRKATKVTTTNQRTSISPRTSIVTPTKIAKLATAIRDIDRNDVYTENSISSLIFLKNDNYCLNQADRSRCFLLHYHRSPSVRLQESGSLVRTCGSGCHHLGVLVLIHFPRCAIAAENHIVSVETLILTIPLKIWTIRPLRVTKLPTFDLMPLCLNRFYFLGPSWAVLSSSPQSYWVPSRSLHLSFQDRTHILLPRLFFSLFCFDSRSKSRIWAHLTVAVIFFLLIFSSMRWLCCWSYWNSDDFLNYALEAIFALASVVDIRLTSWEGLSTSFGWKWEWYLFNFIPGWLILATWSPSNFKSFHSFPFVSSLYSYYLQVFTFSCWSGHWKPRNRLFLI